MLGYFVRKKHVTIYKNNQNIQSDYMFILFYFFVQIAIKCTFLVRLFSSASHEEIKC